MASKTVPIVSGPWSEVINAADEYGSAATALYHAANMYCPNPKAGSAWEIRPPWIEVQAGGVLGGAGGLTRVTEAGDTRITEAGDTRICDGGTLGYRKGQCVYEHTRLDGTLDRYLFVNGFMSEWDGSDTSPVFIDRTPAAIALAATSRIYCTTFANLLIVTDGVNQPWQYDPATATATLIPYNTANTPWTAYGPVVIYDSAIVFIVNTVNGVSMRGTFAWSETNQPLLGYDQDPYDNSWTLAQTSADPLTCLVATNTGLYYFRAQSIGVLVGVIGSSFQTTAQHDAVSQTTGTTTPASVMEGNGYIWFLDHDGWPCRFRVGTTTVEEIGLSARDLIRFQLQTTGLPHSHEVAGFTAYNNDLDRVLMASYAGFNRPTIASSVMSFNADTGAYEGQWSNSSVAAGPALDGLPLFAMGLMHNSAGDLSLCVLSDDTVIGGESSGGAFFRMRTIGEMNSPTWNDPTLAPGTICGILTHQLGVRDVGSWTFERIHVRSRFTQDQVGLALTLTTPNALTSAQTIAMRRPIGVPISLVPNINGLSTDASASMATATAGLQGVGGRWLQVQLQPTTTATPTLPFAPVMVTISAHDSDTSNPNEN